MIGDPCQHDAQLGLRIEPVELGRAGQLRRFAEDISRLEYIPESFKVIRQVGRSSLVLVAIVL